MEHRTSAHLKHQCCVQSGHDRWACAMDILFIASLRCCETHNTEGKPCEWPQIESAGQEVRENCHCVQVDEPEKGSVNCII